MQSFQANERKDEDVVYYTKKIHLFLLGLFGYINITNATTNRFIALNVPGIIQNFIHFKI